MKNNVKVKNMKKLLIAVFLVPSFVYGGPEPTATPFPGTKNGINILPLEKINMPMKEETRKQLRSFSAKGYNETKSTDEAVNSLLNIQKISAKETMQYDNNTNPLDTHLRSDVSKLRLSFNFTGIPEIPKENILGFAPAGGYSHKNGWDGVVEFDRIPTLGTCSFTTFAIKSVIIYKEALEYLINNKPSDKAISGNWNTGFLYHVNWYTDTRRNSLECANKNLKPENLKEMIRIANQIDKNLD